MRQSTTRHNLQQASLLLPTTAEQLSEEVVVLLRTNVLLLEEPLDRQSFTLLHCSDCVQQI